MEPFIFIFETHMTNFKIYEGNNLSLEEKMFLVHFTEWGIKKLGITTKFNVIFSKRGQIQGISTGGYDPSSNDVIARLENRNVIDVARTVAHELVHLRQKEMGKIKDGVPVQDIGGMIEDEANALAGVMLKKYAKEFGRWIYDF